LNFLCIQAGSNAVVALPSWRKRDEISASASNLTDSDHLATGFFKGSTIILVCFGTFLLLLHHLVAPSQRHS
jgi:hypothetical protein